MKKIIAIVLFISLLGGQVAGMEGKRQRKKASLGKRLLEELAFDCWTEIFPFLTQREVVKNVGLTSKGYRDVVMKVYSLPASLLRADLYTRERLKAFIDFCTNNDIACKLNVIITLGCLKGHEGENQCLPHGCFSQKDTNVIVRLQRLPSLHTLEVAFLCDENVAMENIFQGVSQQAVLDKVKILRFFGDLPEEHTLFGEIGEKCPNLKELLLHDAKAPYDHLFSLPEKLELLQVPEIPIKNAAQLKKIIDCFQELKGFELWISSNENATGFDDALVFPHGKNMKEVVLHGYHSISTKGIKNIMTSCPRLQRFVMTLDSNFICDAITDEIFDYMPETLQYLVLSGQVNSFAVSVPEGQTVLIYMHGSFPQITCRGMTRLKISCPRLEFLLLGFCNVGAEGLKSLPENLEVLHYYRIFSEDYDSGEELDQCLAAMKSIAEHGREFGKLKYVKYLRLSLPNDDTNAQILEDFEEAGIKARSCLK